MSIHQGHRARLKERFLSEGLDNFKEHEVMELLLYNCVPRYDVNELSHRLVDHFGFVFLIPVPMRFSAVD